jgi:hypothetical protein
MKLRKKWSSNDSICGDEIDGDTVASHGAVALHEMLSPTSAFWSPLNEVYGTRQRRQVRMVRNMIENPLFVEFHEALRGVKH